MSKYLKRMLYAVAMLSLVLGLVPLRAMAKIDVAAKGGDRGLTAADDSFFGVLISDVEGNVNSGGSYWIDYQGLESPGSRSTATNNFVESGASVYLEAYPKDGYRFVGWFQGEPDPQDGGKLYTGEPLSTERDYSFTAPIGLARPYLCAVFEVDPNPQGDQVQMWVGNTEVVGTSSKDQGGKVAVKYTPSADIYDGIVAKDGTDFVYGEVLAFYKGDECTVYAQADKGYEFVGWYHVNIEWAPGESLAWEGDVISTASSFTYKPGVTILDGDDEALRYVCAVFKKSDSTAHTVRFYADDSKTDLLYTLQVEDGAKLTDPANGVSPAHPDHSLWTFNYWAHYAANGATDRRFAFSGSYASNVPTITADTDFCAVWGVAYRLSVYDLATGKSGGDAECGYLYEDQLDGKIRSLTVGNFTYGAEGHMSDQVTCYAEDGYRFIGWYLVPAGGSVEEDGVLVSTEVPYDYTPENGSGQPDAELSTLYGVFKKGQYTVTFNTHGGTPVPEVQTVAYGGYATRPDTKPELKNMTFDDWYADASLTKRFDFSNTAITSDTELHAGWVFTCLAFAWNKSEGHTGDCGTVTFTNDTMGSSTSVGTTSSTIVHLGTTITAVATPVEGYEFIGWAASDEGPSAEAAETIASKSPTYSFKTEATSARYILAVFVKQDHVHTLVKTEAVPATYTQAGAEAYWTCSECGKYFSDSEGKNEIEEGSWILPRLGEVVVYRMYNYKTSEHLWTTNKVEFEASGKGAYADWRKEGIAWYAPEVGTEGATPVYRLYNKGLGDHHYSANEGEIQKLTTEFGWKSEGIAFYSGGDVDIYRLYNGGLKRGQHHYTTSANERDVLVADCGWKGEGVGFRCLRKGK